MSPSYFVVLSIASWSRSFVSLPWWLRGKVSACNESALPVSTKKSAGFLTEIVLNQYSSLYISLQGEHISNQVGTRVGLGTFLTKLSGVPLHVSSRSHIQHGCHWTDVWLRCNTEIETSKSSRPFQACPQDCSNG